MRKLNKFHYIELTLVVVLIIWLLIFSIPQFRDNQVKSEIITINRMMYTLMDRIANNPALWIREYTGYYGQPESFQDIVNIEAGPVDEISVLDLQEMFSFVKAYSIDNQRLFYFEHGHFKGSIEQFENNPIQPPNYFLIYTPRNIKSDLHEQDFTFEQYNGYIPSELKFDPSNGLSSRGFLSVHSDQILNATEKDKI